MIDDLEHHAFACRPRDERTGPFRLPDARTLGRRLAELRARHGITVAALADAAGLRHHVIEEFEEYGVVSGETLLWLVELLCEGDGVIDAFLRLPMHLLERHPLTHEPASNVVDFRRSA